MNFDSILSDITKRFKINAQDVESRSSLEYYIDLQQDLFAVCTFVTEEYHASLVTLFANDEREIDGCFRIYYSFSLGDARTSERLPLLTLRYLVRFENLVAPSISSVAPAATLYEMEIRDLFGIQFEGHPEHSTMIFHTGEPVAGYPLRNDFTLKEKTVYRASAKDYLHIEGAGVFEIPVGPVHAGIIEPGHFRFSVAGEPIINLEAELYYVHKGIEKLASGKSVQHVLLLAERISGDETFSNSLAYCLAIERIAGLSGIPEKALYSRTIFAEMERLYNHLGDLAGVCIDVAFGFANSQFAMMRRWCQMANEQLTGSRFLRNVNRPGGLRKDFLYTKEAIVTDLLDKLEREFTDTVKIIKKNSLYIDRVEHTGIIQKEVARDLHAVGPAARSAGVHHDARKQFPYLDYQRIGFEVPSHHMGDVNCRVNVKIDEIIQSIQIIRKALKSMPKHEASMGNPRAEIGDLKPYQYAFGITESPRGENAHWVMSGPQNTIYRYKVRTPSFCNWPVLCQAVKGNVVPDFPLINKSFNLSYSGNDL